MEEGTRKTIVWDSNSEPPKDQYWVKDDEVLEYSNGKWSKSNTISTPVEPYELPVASADTLGGVKVGENLSINSDGKLSAQGTIIVHGRSYYQGEGIYDFSPNTGELTLDEALERYKSGTPIILVFSDQDNDNAINYANITYCHYNINPDTHKVFGIEFIADQFTDSYTNVRVHWYA